jgi:hypothetical protein
MSARARTLDVTVIGGDEDAGLLMDTIRELVGRLGLTVVPHQVPAAEAPGEMSAHPAGLSVTVDLASRYQVLTIVRNGPTEVRRTIPRDGSPAIIREVIGEAVRSAVEAQLYVDDLPGSPPPAAEPPPPPVAPAPSPPVPYRGLAVDVTTLAGAGGIATGANVVAHVGGGFVVGSRARLRPSVTITGEYVIPFDTSLANISSQGEVVSLRALGSIEVLHKSWMALNAGAGGGVDIVDAQATGLPMSTSETVTPSTVHTTVDPIVAARVTAYAPLGTDAAFTLALEGDVDLFPSRYVAYNGSGDVTSFWRVRPTLLVGFTFTAMGGGLFPKVSP